MYDKFAAKRKSPFHLIVEQGKASYDINNSKCLFSATTIMSPLSNFIKKEVLLKRDYSQFNGLKFEKQWKSTDQLIFFYNGEQGCEPVANQMAEDLI